MTKTWALHYCPRCSDGTPRDKVSAPFTCERCGYVGRTLNRHGPTGEAANDGLPRVALPGGGFHIQRTGTE